MSSTNKTTNYELSQFVGTDKPAWLSDYNSDMSAIDTQMKVNADAASVADGKAVTNATSIGTLDNLTTDAKTNLVSAINEVDSHADTAQNTANTASNTASGAATAVTALSNYLNLTVFNQITNPTVNNGSITNHGIYVARNAAGTVCKIYGYVGVTNLTGTSCIVTLPDTGVETTEDITVQGLGIFQGDQTGALFNITTTIKSNGNIELQFSNGINNSAGTARMFACMVFVKNFGDLPE